MVKRRGSSSGISLVEMLIAAAICGTLLAVLPRFVTQGIQGLRLSLVRVELARDARTVLRVIAKELRQGRSAGVLIGASSGQPPCSSIEFTGEDGRFTRFWQEGKSLRYQEGTVSQVITNNLLSVSFTYPDISKVTTIKVLVTLAKSGFGPEPRILQVPATIDMRN